MEDSAVTRLKENILAAQVEAAMQGHESLQTCSEDPFVLDDASGYIGDVGYGYQWWSAKAGDHHFNLAWGHGGQLTIVLGDLDMVIVTTADPFFQQHYGRLCMHEMANINLVSEFINSLPSK